MVLKTNEICQILSAAKLPSVEINYHDKCTVCAKTIITDDLCFFFILFIENKRFGISCASSKTSSLISTEKSNNNRNNNNVSNDKINKKINK